MELAVYVAAYCNGCVDSDNIALFYEQFSCLVA
jgi:hypothetical protein